jgi:integrase
VPSGGPGKLLTGNPIVGFKAPALQRAPVRYAERTEAAAFLRFGRSLAARSTVRGRYARLTLLLVRVLIRTGARPKELCRLRWEHITWDGWKLASDHAAAKAVLPEHKTGEKTGKPRTIYLTPALTGALKRVRETAGAPNRHGIRTTYSPDFVFVHGYGRGGRGGGEPWPNGSRLSKAVLRLRRRLIAHQGELRARQASGVVLRPWEARLLAVEVRDEGHDRLVNYRWRHTAISTLLMLGVEVATAAELAGTSPEMIYRHYVHLLDSHLAGAAEKLAGAKRR